MTFTPDQWKAIAAEVKDKAELPLLRTRLEDAAARYHKDREAHPRWVQEVKTWAAVEDQTRALIDLLPPADPSHRELDALLERAGLRRHVAETKATGILDQVHMGRAVSKHTDVPKTMLYRAVLDAWVGAGGTVARSSAKNRLGGPCVRFLSVVFKAIMGNEAPVTPSLKNIIVKRIGERDSFLAKFDEHGQRLPGVADDYFCEVDAHGHVSFKKKS